MTSSHVQFTRANQAELLDAALVLTHSSGWMPDAQALGVMLNGRIDAVLVTQNHTTLGCHAHVGGSPGWATRKVLSTLYRYVFDAKQVPQITFPIATDNVPAQIMALKSGGVISGVFGAGVIMPSPAITVSMTRPMCRWLEPSSTDTTPSAT